VPATLEKDLVVEIAVADGREREVRREDQRGRAGSQTTQRLAHRSGEVGRVQIDHRAAARRVLSHLAGLNVLEHIDGAARVVITIGARHLLELEPVSAAAESDRLQSPAHRTSGLGETERQPPAAGEYSSHADGCAVAREQVKIIHGRSCGSRAELPRGWQPGRDRSPSSRLIINQGCRRG
jgi:hypothetical protein